MTEILTILIPCYNQPSKLNYCLQSLVNQTFKNFKVIVVDDCSTVSYDDVFLKYPELNISYIKNKFNLGAFNNILHCLSYKVDSAYKMVFHEDDVLNPKWLHAAMMILDKDADDVSWIGCNMNFFNIYDNIKFPELDCTPSYYKNKIGALLKHIICGKSLSFCSVIYRSAIIQRQVINLSDYSVLGDRVLLIELALTNGFIYVDSHLVEAFDHKEDHSRWANLKYINIINYYKYIKNLLLKFNDLDKYNKGMFTISLLNNYLLVREKNLFNILFFYSNAYFLGLISFKYHLLFFWRKYLNKIHY